MAGSEERADGNTSASMRVLRLLAGKITAGEFPAGSKLVEEDLSRELGVSRAPLREALLRLEERRLVERRPYSGTRVARVDKRMLNELYEIRCELECLSIRRAVARVTDADMAVLKDHLRDAVSPHEAHELRAIPPGKSLHTKIAEIADSRELLRFLDDDIWLFASMNYTRWLRSSDRIAQARREHAQILEALEYRDSELATLLMRRHILAGLASLDQII